MANVRWKMGKPQCFSHLPFHIRAPFFSDLLKVLSTLRKPSPQNHYSFSIGVAVTTRVIG
jgi:hypothetical protein